MSYKQLLVYGVATMFLVACGGAEIAPGGDDDAPEWSDNPPKGCGTGSAKHRGIRDLTRKTAVSSAREDLARSLRVVIQGMIKRYLGTGEVDGKGFAEEDTKSVTRDVVNQTLAGTRVVKTLMQDGEMYALVCLDPETFADSFERMQKLSTAQRRALKQRAQEEFRDLDRQIDRLNK